MKSTEELIKKYNRPAPRYTSYPPVPYWEDQPSEEEWIKHLQQSYSPEKGIDLYVHVPYCEKLCYYCGCNRSITKNHGVEEVYVSHLAKEWKLYIRKLGFVPVINSLHFGGGTPTFLSPKNLEEIIKMLTTNRQKNFIGSIEIDPRTCSSGHLDVLVRTGITRVSLGIQDFDPKVQEAINRIQPVNLLATLVEKIRAKGITSLNFDLIYGLPNQTKETIKTTIEEVKKMRPDLIAFYSYAHLPDKIKNQRLIKEDSLPSPELRWELYETGRKLLLKEGYVDIGMDHLALKESYLYRAKENGELHRNFMGYVDKKSGVLIGLGPTAISDSGLSFIQNAKEVSDYEKLLDEGKLPIEKGHTLSQKDLLVQETILKLMCENEAPLVNDFPYLHEIQKELLDFSQDGLIEHYESKLILTEKGRAFMRNIAMAFDYRMREKASSVKFSQAI